ncbi:MAG: thiamine-binding protein [Bacillota bacterium]|nr:thiamine-binding protein [Bacillota bacterium]MDW7676424.1 thiamine-binding protein [Bacillota bacterium]
MTKPKQHSTANVSLQVLPSVPPEEVYPVVDQVIALIADAGIRYEVGPMETTMEGDLDTLLEIVRKAQYLCIEAGAGSVMSIVKIHYKPEGVTIDEKVGKYRR